MIDYLIYNGENVLPAYEPGVSGYGQEGSDGNTGEVGPSVYYSSFDLSTSAARAGEARDKINAGKLLSNNLDVDNYNKYTAGDLILDSTGSFYVIKEDENGNFAIESFDSSSNPFALENKNTKDFQGFEVAIITSVVRTSDYSFEQDNPLFQEYSGEDGQVFDAYELKYAESYTSSLYGNWIRFKLDCKTPSEYTYKFVLVLPNGTVLEKRSGVPFAAMFVDNHYLYGCAGISDINMPNPDFGADYNRLFAGNPSLSTLMAYNNFTDNKEAVNARAISLLSARFIAQQCKAYVEISDINTGKVYRYDSSEILEQNQISAGRPDIEWIVDNPIEPGHYFKKPVEGDENYNPDVKYRTFENFLAFQSVYITSENVAGEDELVQGLYFLDKDGLDIPSTLPFDGQPDEVQRIYESTPLYYWRQISLLPQRLGLLPGPDGTYKNTVSNTIKLRFHNIEKLSIKIAYNMFTDPATGARMYPATNLYVGMPNVNLIQLGDENGDVYLSEESKAAGEPDGKAGIYFLHKFVPFGSEIDTTNNVSVPDAGAAIININVSEWTNDLTQDMFIEIGAMMTGEFLNEEHRLSVFKQSENETYTRLSPNLEPGNDYFTFEEGEYGLEENDQHWTPKAGAPDVIMTIQSATPYVETGAATEDTPIKITVKGYETLTY